MIADDHFDLASKVNILSAQRSFCRLVGKHYACLYSAPWLIALSNKSFHNVL